MKYIEKAWWVFVLMAIFSIIGGLFYIYGTNTHNQFFLDLHDYSLAVNVSFFLLFCYYIWKDAKKTHYQKIQKEKFERKKYKILIRP